MQCIYRMHVGTSSRGILQVALTGLNRFNKRRNLAVTSVRKTRKLSSTTTFSTMEPSLHFSLADNITKTIHKKKISKIIEYGTAGFRTKGELLDHVMYRMGLLVVLRSQVKKAAIGLMITASHNPEVDNGVKVVDPAGEMLEPSWETIATNLANVEDADVISTLKNIIKEQNIDTSVPATVIVGRDTRQSSLALSEAAIDGINAMNGIVKNFGVVTTPQLHYLVVCINTNGAYGHPTIEGYYNKLAGAFKKIRGNQQDNGNYKAKLCLDAANGVGSIAIKEFKKQLGDSIDIEVYNDGSGLLNHMCGADYVKSQQTPPMNVPVKPYARCVSIDGDADRIVYYFTDKENRFHLLDGDRIATLVASYLQELIQKGQFDLKLGLVQTAYANGSSTEYISNVLKVAVACVPTGVKHLHHKATEFDIGIYFEANGHGSIVFKDSAVKLVCEAANNINLNETQRTAASKLANVIDVINQTVGDALSDMLLVETILHAKRWDVITWEHNYQDLPYKLTKIKVQDCKTITTTNAERTCITPDGLQKRIDELSSQYSKGRSFARPSGTEDIVRVYAECENAADVERLAAEVSLAVYQMAGGVGSEPKMPSKM